MPRKLKKTKLKKLKFEAWELDFMRNGPPPIEQQIKEKRGFHYLGGRDIWERLQREPGFRASDFPWAETVF
jgi:hypothetical protein